MKKRIFAGIIPAAAALLLTSCNTDTAKVNDTGIFSPERFEMFGQVMLLGMGAVFFALTVLWIVMFLIGKLFGAANKKKAAAEAAPLPEPEPAVTDDGELIAVITAAAAAYIEGDEKLSEEFSGGFRVVSFRRTGK